MKGPASDNALRRMGSDAGAHTVKPQDILSAELRQLLQGLDTIILQGTTRRFRKV